MSYTIDRLDDFGRGITKVDNKICFISNALDNEEIELNVIEEKSKYSIGIQTDIIKKSSDRIIPKCPYFLKCGGCNIMHMNYEKQLNFKYNKLKKILSKFSHLDNVVSDIIPSKQFNYRNKVSLKVKNGLLGFFKDNSYELVEIEKCLLCKDKINETIEVLKKLRLINIDEIIIRVNYKDEVLLCLEGNNIDDKYYLNNLDIIDNIVIIDNENKRIIKGNDYIIDMINDMYFKVSLESFFQVNYYQVSSLYEKVLEYSCLTDNENILDLYCGTGTIGMFLSKHAKNVFGIEINEKAINDANYNKKLNNVKNIEFLCKDVGFLKKDLKNIDLVVIDPPRSGLSDNARKNVIDINPKKIIYVSCDPVTLARDLNLLKNDYMIKKVTPVDMFPNTYHCESITVLERR